MSTPTVAPLRVGLILSSPALGGLGPVSTALFFVLLNPNPKALRTHILGLLGPKTILYKAFGLF